MKLSPIYLYFEHNNIIKNIIILNTIIFRCDIACVIIILFNWPEFWIISWGEKSLILTNNDLVWTIKNPISKVSPLNSSRKLKTIILTQFSGIQVKSCNSIFSFRTGGNCRVFTEYDTGLNWRGLIYKCSILTKALLQDESDQTLKALPRRNSWSRFIIFLGCLAVPGNWMNPRNLLSNILNDKKGKRDGCWEMLYSRQGILPTSLPLHFDKINTERDIMYGWMNRKSLYILLHRKMAQLK